MVHTLPLEMWGSIIDLLQGDTPSLCSCAVVCKGWTPYAQKALISMAHIRGPGSLPRYTSSDERPPRPDKLPGFREAVERTPSFRDDIHTIVVERLLSGLPRPDPWLRNALPVIESLTSKVEHVRLVSNVHLKDEDILAICQAFRDARRFELADIRLDHESFFQFVNTHALITHLSLFHCSVRQYSESSTEIVQVLPSLVHLEFIGISPNLKGWLLKRDNFPSLRTLAIYRAHSNDEAVLAVEMLKLFGSSLEHLYLNLGYDGIAFFRDAHALQLLTNLRTLSLVAHTQAMNLAPIMEDLNAPELEKLALKGSILPSPRFWEPLAATLSRHSTAHLYSLTCVVNELQPLHKVKETALSYLHIPPSVELNFVSSRSYDPLGSWWRMTKTTFPAILPGS